MFVEHEPILVPCSLILAVKEGQETLGPEPQADEAGCTGTLLSFLLSSLGTEPFVTLDFKL